MKQRKWLSRMAATAAAMATLLTGGVVAGTALAADTDEPGLTASKTVTATDKPNVFDVNLSATGRDYAKNREHALFVLDRTGSVGQAEYDEIANAVRSLGRRLMATGQVQVSVVLFAGGAGEENSVVVRRVREHGDAQHQPGGPGQDHGARLYYYYYS